MERELGFINQNRANIFPQPVRDIYNDPIIYFESFRNQAALPRQLEPNKANWIVDKGSWRTSLFGDVNRVEMRP